MTTPGRDGCRNRADNRPLTRVRGPLAVLVCLLIPITKRTAAMTASSSSSLLSTPPPPLRHRASSTSIMRPSLAPTVMTNLEGRTSSYICRLPTDALPLDTLPGTPPDELEGPLSPLSTTSTEAVSAPSQTLLSLWVARFVALLPLGRHDELRADVLSTALSTPSSPRSSSETILPLSAAADRPAFVFPEKAAARPRTRWRGSPSVRSLLRSRPARSPLTSCA
jgi:hypothetical protein